MWGRRRRRLWKEKFLVWCICRTVDYAAIGRKVRGIESAESANDESAKTSLIMSV